MLFVKNDSEINNMKIYQKQIKILKEQYIENI